MANVNPVYLILQGNQLKCESPLNNLDVHFDLKGSSFMRQTISNRVYKYYKRDPPSFKMQIIKHIQKSNPTLKDNDLVTLIKNEVP